MIDMAVRINEDGSISVGILPEVKEQPTEAPKKAEKKAKTTKK